MIFEKTVCYILFEPCMYIESCIYYAFILMIIIIFMNSEYDYLVNNKNILSPYSKSMCPF